MASASAAFGLFEGALGDGAFFVENLRALQLDAGEALVVFGFQIRLIGAGNVIAVDAEQDLPLVHYIAEPSFEFDDAAGSERDAGTARVISGWTTPVTFSAGAALCSTAVARGNWSGWSTLKLLASRSGSTTVFGGASAFGSALPLLHPLVTATQAEHRKRQEVRAGK